jgi:polyisoprenoid-binding protein YceI
MHHIHKLLLIILACSISSVSLADLQLDKSQSQVNFISIKNEHFAETHSFDKFGGTLNADGKLSISIDLSSVNTLIPIRNERMQKMLFDVANFSTATFTASVDTSLLKLVAGQQKQVSIDGTLNISGTAVPTTFHVLIVGLGDGKLSATTTKPTVLSASSFNLDAGISALQEIAMLQSISKTVPLSFSVVFE